MYSLAFIKNVQAIEYEGNFPYANLNYVDTSLPIEIHAKMHSPFVPQDSKTSGTPGFYATFTVKNTSNAPVDVSLMGVITNPLAYDAADRQITNTITKQKDATILTMHTAATNCAPITQGTLSFSVNGGKVHGSLLNLQITLKALVLGVPIFVHSYVVLMNFDQRGNFPVWEKICQIP